jgi:hypothetical protein
MKKLFVLALAATLLVMFTVPAAAAVQHKFSGYWRTRFFSYDALNLQDEGAEQDQAIDTRTRIYYRPVLHDNLRADFRFEMDAEWGRRGSAYSTSASYGARGADGVAVEVKRAFITADWANLQWRIGTQGFEDPSGGYIFDDDYTGMKIDYRTDNYIAGLWWIRTHEGQPETNGADTDLVSFIFNYKTGNHRFVPWISYQWTNDLQDAGRRDRLGLGPDFVGERGSLYFLGFRWDGKFGNWDIYAFGIYEGGTLESSGGDVDVSAYAGEVKATVKMGQWGAWGRFMYASGDDDMRDNDAEGWYLPGMVQGSVSDYAEFYGGGAFDRNLPAGAHGKEMTNLMNFGLGGWFDFSKAWTASLAWWYLNFAEDGPYSQQVFPYPREVSTAGNGEDKNIGNEFDFWATYNVMQAMKLHFIFSYLILGDAIEPDTNSQDPWELGAQLEIRW